MSFSRSRNDLRVYPPRQEREKDDEGEETFWTESQLLDEQLQEDEVSQADTVSTVMETSSYTGLPDSVYSNYIRKVKHLEIGILHWMFSELAVLRRVDRVGQRLLPHLLGDHQRDGPVRLGLIGSGSKLLVNCN